MAGSQLCCALDKFSKNRFCGDRWVVCSFLRRIRPSGSGGKINFTKNFGSGGDVVFRDSVMASETAWLSMASETAQGGIKCIGAELNALGRNYMHWGGLKGQPLSRKELPGALS